MHRKHFRGFVFSEGRRYQDLELASDDLSRARTAAIKMDEWAFLLRSPGKDLALLFFENLAARQTIRGMLPGGKYKAQWFNPRTGEWFDMAGGALVADKNGTIEMPAYPSGKDISDNDWAAKLKRVNTP